MDSLYRSPDIESLPVKGIIADFNKHRLKRSCVVPRGVLPLILYKENFILGQNKK